MQSPIELVHEGQTVTFVEGAVSRPALVTRVVSQYRGPLTAVDVQLEGETGRRTNIPAESMRMGSSTYWKFAPAGVTVSAPVDTIPEPTVAPEAMPETPAPKRRTKGK